MDAVIDQEPEELEPESSPLRSLESLKRLYCESADSASSARKLAFRDRDWFDNYDDAHWDDKEKAELKRRGMPNPLPTLARDAFEALAIAGGLTAIVIAMIVFGG